VLLQIERLAPQRAVDAEFGELRVHVGLLPPPARPADQRLTQILPPVNVQIPEEGAEPRHVADFRALLRVRLDEHDRGIHLRPRVEVRRQYLPNHLHVRDALHQHRQRVVVLRVRNRPHPLRDLPLHHHHHPLDVRAGDEQVADDRRRDHVGQVRDELLARTVRLLRGFVPRGEHVGVQLVLRGERVAEHELHVSALADHLLRDRLERPVDLDGDDRTSMVGEPRSERPGAGADLQHRVGRVEFRRADDQVEQVQVDEEVLAELALGLQPVVLEEAQQVRERLARRRNRRGWRLRGVGHGIVVSCQLSVVRRTVNRVRTPSRHPSD
jgi:hypothetical protein